jgi:dCTP deaminase
MILTGPEIRAQIEHGVEDVRGGVRKYVGLSRHEDVTTMDYIHVDPYDPELVGPNSVDLRLGNKLLTYHLGAVKHLQSQNGLLTVDKELYQLEPLDMRRDNPSIEIEIPQKHGLVLYPGVLYLGRTIECIGSNKFVPIVEGRSSVGRLGIHVHVTAGFCDLGFRGTITLEIHVIHPVRIYPNIPICQAYFLKPEGAIELYKGRYMNQEEPTASRFSLSKEEFQK